LSPIVSTDPAESPTERRKYSGGRIPDFVLAFAFLVLVVIGLSVVEYVGFCLTQFRFLSRTEIVDAAIRDVIGSTLHVYETPTGGFATFHPPRQIKYRDVEEFRRLNPECCELVSNDRQWVSFTWELSGYARATVRVRYSVRYLNDDGTMSRGDAIARVLISNCGKVTNTDY
jgi:hypothetical protein